MSEQSQPNGSDEGLDRVPDSGDEVVARFGWAVSALSIDRSGTTVLWLVGEADLFTLPALGAALAAGLDRCDGRLVVDVSRLTFCSIAGFGLLERAETTAAENGIDYVVRGCSPSLARLRALLRQVDQVRQEHLRPSSGDWAAEDSEPAAAPEPRSRDQNTRRTVRVSSG